MAAKGLARSARSAAHVASAARDRTTRTDPRPLAAAIATVGIVVLALVWLPDRLRVGGAVAEATGAAGAGSAASSVPRGEATPTTAPTADAGDGSPSPPADTPAPAGPPDIRIAVQAMRPWQDPQGELRAQVLARLENRGGSPGLVRAVDTAWRIVGADGTVTAASQFGHVFPSVVAPGETAWLVDTVSVLAGDPAELQSLEVEAQGGPLGDLAVDRTETLRAADVEWSATPSDGVSVAGTVHNDGAGAVARVGVCAVLVAADGRPLAGVYDVSSVTDIGPGEAAAFETSYPGSAPVDRADVATVDVVLVALPAD